MGILHHMPQPNTYCWVMGEPKSQNFMKPTKVLFHRVGLFYDSINNIRNNLAYQESMIFDNNLIIHVFDSGMKSGHRVTMNYYVAKTSKDLFVILNRILNLTSERPCLYDYNMINDYIKYVEAEFPELLI